MGKQMQEKVETIHGLDPLSFYGDGKHEMLESFQRRLIQNILKSYTGKYDIFSELLQNSLDAVDRRRERQPKFKGKIWILIDIRKKKIRITDNGCGMTLDEFKFFLAPNITYKEGTKSRGQKGVGATFLAYGYSFLHAQTKSGQHEIAAKFRDGRRWVEDETNNISRPTFEQTAFDVEELDGEKSGTAIEIILGQDGDRPKDLGWLGAQTAAPWAEILRIQTPLGGVYLTGEYPGVEVSLEVISAEGNSTCIKNDRAEFYYPHEIPHLKVQDLRSIQPALERISGSPQEKLNKLPNEFKKLNCIYEVWVKDNILKEDGLFARTIDESDRQLIERHAVSVYGCFMDSAKKWTKFNEEDLNLRKGQKVIRGGLQLASDTMIQGDLIVIPLTSAIGYQANSFVIVHFDDGNPDMGRKVFQPELKDLGLKLAVRVVNEFKKYLQLLRPDSGVTKMVPDKELHEWRKTQEIFRDSNSYSIEGAHVLSTPQQEQDVIALFHELVGSKILRGYKFFSTSQSERYDSLYLTECLKADGYTYNEENNRLGIATAISLPYESSPLILEFKFDFDALVTDIDKDIKFPSHIDLVVCWQTSKTFKEKYFFNSLLVGDAGQDRMNFGATHQAIPQGSGQPDFEVIVLKDLTNFLSNPDAEIARQKIFYGDN